MKYYTHSPAYYESWWRKPGGKPRRNPAPLSQALRNAAQTEIDAAIDAESDLPADGRALVRTERMRLQSALTDREATPDDLDAAIRECARVRKMWLGVAS